MAAKRWYGPLGEVYTSNPGFPIPSGTGFGFIGYGNSEIVFPTLAEWRNYLSEEERFRQNSVLVKKTANDNLLNQLDILQPGATEQPGSLQFFVISEDGTVALFGNQDAAQEWGITQNKAYALFQIGSVALVELPAAEVAVRVEAL